VSRRIRSTTATKALSVVIDHSIAAIFTACETIDSTRFTTSAPMK
jgi:hypothetical protein